MTQHGNLYLKNGTQFFLCVYFMVFFFKCYLTTFVIERKKPLKNHLDSSRPKGSQTVKRKNELGSGKQFFPKRLTRGQE